MMSGIFTHQIKGNVALKKCVVVHITDVIMLARVANVPDWAVLNRRVHGAKGNTAKVVVVDGFIGYLPERYVGLIHRSIKRAEDFAGFRRDGFEFTRVKADHPRRVSEVCVGLVVIDGLIACGQ